MPTAGDKHAMGEDLTLGRLGQDLGIAIESGARSGNNKSGDGTPQTPTRSSTPKRSDSREKSFDLNQPASSNSDGNGKGKEIARSPSISSRPKAQ